MTTRKLQRNGRVFTTDFKPTLTDVKAADHSNNFAARMGFSCIDGE